MLYRQTCAGTRVREDVCVYASGASRGGVRSKEMWMGIWGLWCAGK